MRYTSAMRTLFLTTVISVAFAQAPSEPTDVQGWIRHGLEAVKAGRHDDALKAMDRALQIDPNNLHALHTLAFLQFNRDMLTEARATYERILGITPDGKEAHYGLAAVLSKNIESMRKKARAQSNLAPDAPGPIPLPSARGQYQAEAAPMIDEATRHLDQVLQKDPTFVPAIAYMNQLHSGPCRLCGRCHWVSTGDRKGGRVGCENSGCTLFGFVAGSGFRLRASADPRWSRSTESEVSTSRRAGLPSDGPAGPDPGRCPIQRCHRRRRPGGEPDSGQRSSASGSCRNRGDQAVGVFANAAERQTD